MAGREEGLPTTVAARTQIVAIKYYTAPVSGKPDSGQPIRQQTYLRDLHATNAELVVHNEHFLTPPEKVLVL